jgi:hypothetical protein
MPLVGGYGFLACFSDNRYNSSRRSIIALRFLYFPIIGLFIIMVWVVSKVLDKLKNGVAIGKMAGVIVICLCIVLSSNQLRVWQNSLTLFEQALKNTSNNFRRIAIMDLRCFIRVTHQAKEHILDALRYTRALWRRV